MHSKYRLTPAYMGYELQDTIIIAYHIGIDDKGSLLPMTDWYVNYGVESVNKCSKLIGINDNNIYYDLKRENISLPTYDEYDTIQLNRIHEITGASFILVSKTLKLRDHETNMAVVGIKILDLKKGAIGVGIITTTRSISYGDYSGYPASFLTSYAYGRGLDKLCKKLILKM